MNITDKALTLSSNNVTIAENQEKVYDKGYSDAESNFPLEMWKILTSSGNRTNYIRAFASTSFPKGFAFPEPIKPTSYSSHMFYDYYGAELPLNIDLSGVRLTGTWENSAAMNIFSYARSITTIYDMGLPAPVEYRNSFQYCYKLTTIEKIRVAKETKFYDPFLGSTNLANVTFEGEIGQNLSLGGCTKLTHKSLMNIIGCLYDFVSNGETTTRTLTIGSENLLKLTDEEKAIATQKGWTLA